MICVVFGFGYVFYVGLWFGSSFYCDFGLCLDLLSVVFSCCLYCIVVGVMEMGNNVSSAGIEHTTLAFQASVLPLHQTGSLISPLYPYPLVYADPCLTGQCSLLHSSPGILSLLMLTILCIQAMTL